MDNLLTPAEAAEILKITRRTIYLWIKNEKIEAYKIGRIVRIPISEIERLKVGGK